jgi:hypothetical protein
MDHTELLKQLRQAMFNNAWNHLATTARQLHELGVSPKESLEIYAGALHNIIVEHDGSEQGKHDVNGDVERVWEAALERMTKTGRSDA